MGVKFLFIFCAALLIHRGKITEKKDGSNVIPNETVPAIINAMADIDTSISDIHLRNGQSVFNKLGDIEDLYIEDRERGEIALFFNRDKSEYFALKREYGGYKNQCAYFYVGKRESKPRGKISNSDIGHFCTNRNVCIGMNEADFKSLNPSYSIDVSADENNRHEYSYSDDEFYFATYVFRDSVLIEYSFGYETP